MKSYIALLRGINVSGQKLIKMAELKVVLEGNGFQNVATYIQSGNIIFDAPETSEKELALRLSNVIADHYHFSVPVLLLDQEVLQSITANNPFLTATDMDLKQLYIAFLSETPLAAAISVLESAAIAPDLFSIERKTVYIRYRTSAGVSKLTNKLIENKLQCDSTMRNWKTTVTLSEMLSKRVLGAE